jgi:hypothetical protein
MKIQFSIKKILKQKEVGRTLTLSSFFINLGSIWLNNRTVNGTTLVPAGED